MNATFTGTLSKISGSFLNTNKRSILCLMKASVIPPETDASGREGDNSESLALFIVYAEC